MCPIIRRQREGPFCLGLAIDLPMHPPLRIRLTFHNGFRDPVDSVFRRSVAYNLTADVSEGKVCARTFKKRRRNDDSNGCVHFASRGKMLVVNTKGEELWHFAADDMMALLAMVRPRLA